MGTSLAACSILLELAVIMLFGCSTTYSDDLGFSKKICGRPEKERKESFTLPESNGEQLEITFECDSPLYISACQLPGMPRGSTNGDTFPTFSYTAKSGLTYAVTCFSMYDPTIREKFAANICKTEAKTADVTFPEKDSKPISVRFNCAADSLAIKSCQPTEIGTVLARKSAVIDGTAGKSKYRFSCKTDARPTLALTFAGKICETKAKSEKYTVGKESNPLTLAFDCNDDNNRITLCKPEGYLRNVKAGKMKNYGWTKDSEFALFCNEIDGPEFY